MTARYLVVGRQPWNRTHFRELLLDREGEWEFAANQDDLRRHNGRWGDFDYVFFLHWSQIVPDEILSATRCVCFHMTDVPFGRGGSPLQNLIARGIRETMLTALEMTSELDAGPVFAKRPLSLEGSTAEEIYIRASELSCELAIEIADTRPSSIPQSGESVVFKRRTPAESLLPTADGDLQKLHDHIRMLDAEGYPKSFLELGNLRFEFTRAARYADHVQADVRITIRDDESEGDQ